MTLENINRKKPERVMLVELLLIFVSLTAMFGVLFQYFVLFQRFELETINHRFEARRWIKWSPISLERLNPQKLIAYHEKHEIPKRWWCWDYTLSWLIEENHAQPAMKIIVFNRLLEDEPPGEAVESHAWMQPLLNYPLPRETLADFVSFLAASGVKAICLDYDFPQYSSGDAVLAKSIVDAMNGKNGKPVPVILANTVHTVTAGNISQLHDPVTRSGVIRKIQELDPSTDAVEKYTGLTGVLQDEDQVVRRLVLSLSMPGGKKYGSVVVRTLESLHWPLPNELPEVIDVDFISVPNSAVYPVRPLSYLLDPDLKKKIASDNQDDVSLKDSVVIIGDGISDLYDTPLTNLGLDRRSGSELLAQGLDTLARQSWLNRLSPAGTYLYVILTALLGGLNFILFRHLYNQWRLRSEKNQTNKQTRSKRGVFDVSDLFIFLWSLLSVYIIANLLFSFANLIVPMVVPAIATTLGMLVTVLWERDRIKVLSMEEQIKSSQEKLILSHEKHEAELAYQSTLAEQKANEEARRRRQDMVRRLNHDLKAPISVFNWTLAKLLKDRPPTDPLFAVFERLKKSSEHLSNLLSEIVKSLADEEQLATETGSQTCEITHVLKKQSELEMSLAEITASRVVLDLPENNELVFVMGSELEVARIVDNIVGNALKHNAAGTTVTIKLEPCDWTRDRIQVSVSDDGKGISEDDLEKIFQAGFRAGVPRNEGQGLGLSIASTLVKKIGGEINVESTVGKGTCFNIYLQLYRSASDSADSLEETAEAPVPDGEETASPERETNGSATASSDRISNAYTKAIAAKNGDQGDGKDDDGNGESALLAGQETTRN